MRGPRPVESLRVPRWRLERRFTCEFSRFPEPCPRPGGPGLSHRCRRSLQGRRVRPQAPAAASQARDVARSFLDVPGCWRQSGGTPLAIIERGGGAGEAQACRWCPEPSPEVKRVRKGFCRSYDRSAPSTSRGRPGRVSAGPSAPQSRERSCATQDDGVKPSHQSGPGVAEWF